MAESPVTREQRVRREMFTAAIRDGRITETQLQQVVACTVKLMPTLRPLIVLLVKRGDTEAAELLAGIDRFLEVKEIT